MSPTASIRRKVALALFAATALALTTAAVAVWVFEYRATDLRARATLESLAETMVPGLVASLDFNTPDVAAAHLRRLESGELVLAASVFRTGPAGTPPQLFASYVRHGTRAVFPPRHDATGFQRNADRALYTHPIVVEGEWIAVLQIEADIAPFRRSLHESLIILALVLAVLALSGIGLTHLLQRALTRPLLNLAAIVERVRKTGDYSTRAAFAQRDEVGRLAEGVDLMLATIEQRDRQLAEQTAFKEAVLENAGVSIISTDTTGTIRTFNAASERLLGYSRDEIVGRETSMLYLDPAEVARRAGELGRHLGRDVAPGFGFFVELAREAPSALEWVHLRKDGTRVPVFVVLSTLRAADGRYLGLCAIGTDLTERKAAEAAVRASEERMHRSFEASPIALALSDQTGGVLYLNRKFTEWFGYTTADIPSVENWYSLAYPDPFTREHNKRVWDGRLAEASARGGEMQPMEAEVTCRDGRRRLIEFRCQQFEGLLLIAFTDITERKATEEALRLSQSRLEAAQAQAHIGNWDLDLATGSGFWSEQMFRIFGLEPTRPPPPYDAFMAMIHPDDRERLLEAHNDVVATGNAMTTEYRTRTVSGRIRYIEANIRVIRDSSGKPTNLAGTLQDITERRRAEDEVRRLNAELEQRVRDRTAELEHLNADLRASQDDLAHAAARLQEANSNLLAANQELESFSYSVSHDLRSPLRNIAGFIELLRKRTAGQLDSEADRYFGIVGTEAVRMAALIDDLLTFSRIGRAELHFAPVQLATLVAEVQAELQSDLAGRLIEWRLQPLPPVLGDRTLLRQVVANLLANAVKFTRKRSPAIIEISTQPSSQDPELITFFVRDNGAGFDPKYSAKLFGVFQRLHNPRDFEGTGIGLANVRRIVERHGGHTWAEGAPDNGATFFFSLKPASFADAQ